MKKLLADNPKITPTTMAKRLPPEYSNATVGELKTWLKEAREATISEADCVTYYGEWLETEILSSNQKASAQKCLTELFQQKGRSITKGSMQRVLEKLKDAAIAKEEQLKPKAKAMTQSDLRAKYAEWIQGVRVEDPHIPIRALIAQIEAKEKAPVNFMTMQRLLYELDLPGEHPPTATREKSQADFMRNDAAIGHCYVGQPHLKSRPSDSIYGNNLATNIILDTWKRG